jgi:hypothetical protein
MDSANEIKNDFAENLTKIRGSAMKEKDIQLYLYNNPQVLFPDKTIKRKEFEYSIQGKRIDLLFDVEGMKYIVECKKGPISREDIGQVIEYYGLMKTFLQENDLKMMLVAPEIARHRKTYLEELGIACIQVDSIPDSNKEQMELMGEVKKANKKQAEKSWLVESLHAGDRICRDDLSTFITKRQIALLCKLVQDLLLDLSNSFHEYELTPYRVMKAYSAEYFWQDCNSLNFGENKFVPGGAWFALSFGPVKDMPPNDLPNISAAISNHGFEITINAELMNSQKIFVKKIMQKPQLFDGLLRAHDDLWFKSYLKIEHQPQIYHWILLDCMATGQFDSQLILSIDDKYHRSYHKLKEEWANKIIENQNLSDRQIEHIKTKNPNPKIAMRLAKTFSVSDPIWDSDFETQKKAVKASIDRLKPLLDFFLS